MLPPAAGSAAGVGAAAAGMAGSAAGAIEAAAGVANSGGGGAGLPRPSGSLMPVDCGGAGEGEPKPPRAQSTTLLCANLPQISSPLGGAGGAAGLDHSDAGVAAGGAGATFHAESTGAEWEGGGLGAAHPSTVGAASVGAPHPSADGAGDAGTSRLSGIPAPADDGVQFCDIGPVPEIAEPVGTASQRDGFATGGAALSPASPLQPLHSGELGAGLAAVVGNDAPSSAAAISKLPTRKTSPWAIVRGSPSRALWPSRNVPLVLVSISSYLPSTKRISQWREEIWRDGSGRHQSLVAARPTMAPRRSSTSDNGDPLSRLAALRMARVSVTHKT